MHLIFRSTGKRQSGSLQRLNGCIHTDTMGDLLMFLVEQTESFAAWLSSLKDLRAQLAIGRRLERAALGNFGDFKWLGGGIGELRVDVAAGYRVYFTQKGHRLVLLLVGGDKSTQPTDILKARKLLKEMT